MTKQQASSFIKENWQPVTSILIFVFALGGFYVKTSAYDERFVTMKAEREKQIGELKADVRETQKKQEQYNTDVAVIKNQIIEIDKNVDRLLKR